MYKKREIEKCFVSKPILVRTWEFWVLFTLSNVVLSAVGSPDQDSSESFRHFQAGNENHASGNIKNAIKNYKTAIKINDQFADAHCNLGAALMDYGDKDGALKAYKTALKIDSVHGEANFGMGQIYQDSGALSKALTHYQLAVSANPKILDAWVNLGIIQLEQMEYFEASKSFQMAINLIGTEIYEFNSDLYFHLGVALFSIQDPSECTAGKCLQRATEAFKTCLKYNPDHPQAEHFLKVLLEGDSFNGASPKYVKALFDSYAETFDEELSQLKYEAPQLVHQSLMQTLTKIGREGKMLTIIDAGCGTGLAGPLFRENAAVLIGIDLSPNMLDRARQRGVYDQLIEGDIVQVLQQLVNADKGPSADVIVSTDVFIYFGNLHGIFEAAAKVLKHAGLLAFTTERAEHPEENTDQPTQGWKILQSGRFAHFKNYVEEVARNHGFAQKKYIQVVPRYELGEPIHGHLFIFQKI